MHGPVNVKTGLKFLFVNRHVRVCSSVLLTSQQFARRYDIGTRPSCNTLYKQNVEGYWDTKHALRV